MAKNPNTELLNPFPDRDGSRTDREARIRQRAFDMWEAEGKPEGREHDHWLAAEREVLMAEPEPTLGVPITQGKDIPGVRSAGGAGVPGAQPDNANRGRSEAPMAPKTAGAPKPAPDTSKSRVANRDVEGPRKASTTPRPTRKPIGGK
jgi:hypothetical protein